MSLGTVGGATRSGWNLVTTERNAAEKTIYRRGTHRTLSPEKTFERFRCKARVLGVTRLADISGLDYLGIPVFMAVRPNGRALSQAQGKGIDRHSALVSAFMEAAEFAHAEKISPEVKRTTAAMRAESAITEPRSLPRRKGFGWSDEVAIGWTEGRDLTSGAVTFVPFEMVHTDHTLPQTGPHAALNRSSNGLGAGNTLDEAIIAGLCELIERDATALWRLLDPAERASRRVKLRGVENIDCVAQLERYDEHGLSVAIWDVTSDIGIACFLCRVREGPTCKRDPLGDFWGAGCHLDRDVALIRALTEAAQSRLTYIVGARDDLESDLYSRRHLPAFAEIIDLWEQRTAGRNYGEVPSLASATLEADVDTLLRSLDAANLPQVVVVDLTDDMIAIPVVRVVVPGLEADRKDGRLRMGPRALKFAGGRK